MMMMIMMMMLPAMKDSQVIHDDEEEEVDSRSSICQVFIQASSTYENYHHCHNHRHHHHHRHKHHHHTHHPAIYLSYLSHYQQPYNLPRQKMMMILTLLFSSSISTLVV